MYSLNTLVVIVISSMAVRGEGESCANGDFIVGVDDEDIHFSDDSLLFERISRERGLGAKQRELGSRIHSSVRKIPCGNGLMCINNRCVVRPPSGE
jgi:hypothetical protein